MVDWRQVLQLGQVCEINWHMKRVVFILGGCTDSQSFQLWKPFTMSMTFLRLSVSTTKWQKLGKDGNLSHTERATTCMQAKTITSSAALTPLGFPAAIIISWWSHGVSHVGPVRTSSCNVQNKREASELKHCMPEI